MRPSSYSLLLFREMRLSGLFLLYCICSICLQAAPTKISGVDYESLQAVAARFGMKANWVERDKSMRLQSQWTTLDFTLHKRDFTINGNKVYLGNPIAAKAGKLYLSSIDYEKTLKPLLTPQADRNVPQIKHIVIDAGHGGKDPGAQNTALKLREKDLTLDLAKRLKRELEAAGYRVSLTRATDKFIELGDRPMLSNRAQADFFISLHFNSSTNTTVNGIETYAFTPCNQPSTSGSKVRAADRQVYPSNKYDFWSLLSAFYIQRQLVADMKVVDRGVKRARFAVLKTLNCPGVLVEGGFLSNTREGKNVGWNQYRDNLAKAICKGIQTYDKSLQRVRR